MSTTHLYIDQIRTNAGTQPRAELVAEAVEDYKQTILNGGKLPAITVFYDGLEYFLVDGFHRTAATREAGQIGIDCEVIQGTLEEAKWYSYGANKEHGLRRTNGDKERAVKSALKHPFGPTKSDSDIAQYIGVSPSTVAKYRQELESTFQIGKLNERTGRDGKKRKVGATGKGKGTGKSGGKKPKTAPAPPQPQSGEPADADDNGLSDEPPVVPEWNSLSDLVQFLLDNRHCLSGADINDHWIARAQDLLSA